MKLLYKFRQTFICALLTTSGVLSAQETQTPYVDFDSFSMVRPAEDVGFTDGLMWGTMAFLNLSALDRIVPLYTYNIDNVNDCEANEYKNIPSLALANGYLSNDVNHALNQLNFEVMVDDELRGQIDREDLVMPMAYWLDLYKNYLSLSQEQIETLSNDLGSIPIWSEVRGTNACDFAQILQSEMEIGSWNPVTNPILQAASRDAFNALDSNSYAIMTAEPLVDLSALVEFYAECSENTHNERSLCARQNSDY